MCFREQQLDTALPGTCYLKPKAGVSYIFKEVLLEDSRNWGAV